RENRETPGPRLLRVEGAAEPVGRRSVSAPGGTRGRFRLGPAGEPAARGNRLTLRRCRLRTRRRQCAAGHRCRGWRGRECGFHESFSARRSGPLHHQAPGAALRRGRRAPPLPGPAQSLAFKGNAMATHVLRREPAAETDRDARIAELRRMRIIATSLLVLMTVIFVATTAARVDWRWLPYLRAFAEAGMVGACADWFAVVALFRHPLGIPIPHTAIVPNNKARIGPALGRFITNNFL